MQEAWQQGKGGWKTRTNMQKWQGKHAWSAASSGGKWQERSWEEAWTEPMPPQSPLEPAEPTWPPSPQMLAAASWHRGSRSPSRPSERAVTVADAGRQAAPVPLAQSCAVEVETEVGHQRLLAPTDIAPPVRKRDRRPIGFASHSDGQVAAVHDSTLPSLRTNVNALCRPPDIVAKPHWGDLFRTAADESDSRTMPVEWTWKEGTADAITSDDTMLSSTDMKQRHRTPGRPLDVVVSGPVDVQCLTTGSNGGGTLAFSFATPPPTPRASRGRPHGRPPDLHGSSKVGVQDATMDAIVKKFHIGGDRPPDLSPGRPPEPEASQGHTDAVDDMNRELARLLGEITLMCASANANEISTSRRVPRHFGWLNLDSAHPEPPPLSEGSRGQPGF